jgi:hypothetical protein
MVPTAEAQDAPARAAVERKPRTPKALQKRKLTLAAAIDQYEETARAIEGLTPLRDEAKAVIIAHGERTGRRTFKDRIAMVSSGGALVLNQAKAVEFILEAGERLEDFKTRTKLGWSLKLLK